MVNVEDDDDQRQHQWQMVMKRVEKASIRLKERALSQTLSVSLCLFVSGNEGK